MSSDPTVEPTPAAPKPKRLLLKCVVGLVAVLAIVGTLLFVPAGRLDWGMGWACLAVLLACVGVNATVLLRVNPEVIDERLRGPKGAKTWDLVLASSAGVAMVVTLVVAAQDQRFAWSMPTPLWLQITGLVMVGLGDALLLWAMAVNKFFSKFVRIQTERGHHAVCAGPYQYVRHPGYVGWIIMSVGLPLFLGSLWALVPTAVSIILIVVRTVLEDRILRRELAGYADYAHRVRCRLVPGIW